MRTTRTPMKFRATFIASLTTIALFAIPSGARATAPGPVGRIAFDDFYTGQIYAVNPDGTALTQLSQADGKHQAMQPAWTSDGSQVVYSQARFNFGHGRIWIVNADGTDAHRVAGDEPGFTDSQPAITPDGRFIVFVRCEPGGVCSLWRMRSDGTGLRALTPFQDVPNETFDFDPSISGDGKRIAFSRYFADGIIARVFEMRLDGSALHAVTTPSQVACIPDWAPDGETIAFISRCTALNGQVFTSEPSGDNPTQLTHDRYPNGAYDTAFSPDDDQIAFSDDRRYDDFCCVDLFVMNADGSDQHRVPIGDLAGVVHVSWGSAPLETGPAASSVTHTMRSLPAGWSSRTFLVRPGGGSS
jgi:Tol biopolymer transport system component